MNRYLCYFYFQILYTQPNPSIKYEYFTESLPGEIESDSVTKADFPEVSSTAVTKHYRRHHSYDVFPRTSAEVPRHPDLSFSNEDEVDEVVVGNMKFMWKILSYSQCTRTCGGGIQVSDLPIEFPHFWSVLYPYKYTRHSNFGLHAANRTMSRLVSLTDKYLIEINL